MSKEKLVRRVEEISEAVQGMMGAMEKTPEKEAVATSKVTEFQKKFPDALYIKPSIEIPTGGVKHPKLEKDREHLHEYVVGIFESTMIGSRLEFFLTGLPGDPYCKWVIPVNKTIGIPRFVAKHLSTKLSWKEMKPIGRENIPESYYEEEMMIPFSRFEHKRRGTFHPINSY